jgi:hypothetical protein
MSRPWRIFWVQLFAAALAWVLWDSLTSPVIVD